jgi:RNA polymerase sigma factor for flagellar operon FliA
MAAAAAASVRQAPAAAAGAVSGASEELALWRQLRGGRDAAARDQLLAIHLPYARVVAAAYFSRRFHDEIEFGDYLQYASIGLLEALERFDPDRGAQFRTFAARRMHGSILNGIERFTEKQQQIAARQRLRAERLEALKQQAEQTAGGAAARLGNDKLRAYVAEVGIGLALAWLLEGTAMIDCEERAQTLPFYRNAEIRQVRERLAQAVDALPPQERTVVRHHYLQEVAFDQIAALLGVTKGRVSQIHRQALLRLRAVVGDQVGVDSCF